MTAPAGSFGAALRAEAYRVRTRTTLALVVLAIGLAAALTAMMIAAAGKPGGPDLGTTDGIHQVLANGFGAALFAQVIGVILVTTEFRHRTAAVSMLAVGSRSRWLLAKAVVATVLGLACTAAGGIAIAAVAVPMLHAKGVSVPLTSGMLPGVLAATALLGVFPAVIGVGLGALIRHQGAAVTVVVTYVVAVEGALMALLPSPGRYLPGGAIAAIGTDPTVRHFSVLAGFALLAAWAAAALFFGTRRLMSSDLPL